MYFILFLAVVLLSVGIYMGINLIENKVFKREEWQQPQTDFSKQLNIGTDSVLSSVSQVLNGVKDVVKTFKPPQSRSQTTSRTSQTTRSQSPPPPPRKRRPIRNIGSFYKDAKERTSKATRQDFVRVVSSIKLHYGSSVDEELYQYIGKNMNNGNWNQMCDELKRRYPNAF